MVTLVVVLVLCSFPVCWAVITIRFDDEFNSCPNGMDMISWDMSEFSVLMMDNENFTLHGNLGFTKDFNNPTSMNIKLERNNNGLWIPIVTRFVPNFCDVIKHPKDMWSTVMAAFSQQNCPFLAGHVEKFNDTNIGSMTHQLMLPPNMLGDWRMFLEVRTVRTGKMETECVQANFLLQDE